MSLRKRTMVIFILTVSLSSVLTLFLSRFFYLGGYSKLEQIEAFESCERALALLQDDIQQLDMILKDWAVWDDSYRYMQGNHDEYELSNLSEGTFKGLNLASILFLDNKAAVRYEYAIPQIKASQARSWFLPLIDDEVPMALSGLVKDGNRVYITAARAILRTDGSGPAAGLLCMSRVVDSRLLERYSNLIGVSIAIQANEEDEAISRSGDYIQARLPIRDIYGEQSISISIEKQRSIYRHGLDSFSYYAGAVFILMILISLAAFGILESVVFRSIHSIGLQLERISAGVYPDERLVIPEGDEVGVLAQVMNKTLDTLYVRIRERETMLREIHHRVKNNLQIIVSLLNLQASKSENPEVSRALNISRRRVLAMAVVHNELYDDPDLSFISLEALLQSFTRSYEPQGAPRRAIKLNLHVPELYIDIDRAIPLGLIISEVLSNAYIHAFPGTDTGTVEIWAEKQGRSGFILKIHDNGIGIAPENERQKGLGIAIIEALSGQLEAESSLKRVPRGGTLFVLNVPDSDKKTAYLQVGSKQSGQSVTQA